MRQKRASGYQKDIEQQLKEADEEDGEDEEQPEEKNYEQEAHEYVNEQIAAMGMTEDEYIEFWLSKNA